MFVYLRTVSGLHGPAPVSHGQKKNLTMEGAMQTVKIPASLEVFKFRKTDQDWSLGFAIAPEFIEHAKPLMKMMNKSFILVCVQVDDITEARTLLQADGVLSEQPATPAARPLVPRRETHPDHMPDAGDTHAETTPET